MIHPYASPIYANAFGEGYEPFVLKNSNTYVLLRRIAGTNQIDAMGPYPLTPFTSQIKDDFAALEEKGAVSLVGVADPFFSPSQAEMKKIFDHVVEFKEHFITDLSKTSEYNKHHRYEVRRAHKLVETRVISLKDNVKEWYVLYKNLIDKHEIKGISAFSEKYFEEIAKLNPVTIGAYAEDKLVSTHIWFEYEGHVYSHLAASNELGYRLRAAYAVYDASIAHFKKTGAKVIDFGGGAGATEASKGLTFLKKGFSNNTAMCYIFGKILDEEAYKELSKGKNGKYFPLYRS